jgi:hypothetical protein
MKHQAVQVQIWSLKAIQDAIKKGGGNRFREKNVQPKREHSYRTYQITVAFFEIQALNRHNLIVSDTMRPINCCTHSLPNLLI